MSRQVTDHLNTELDYVTPEDLTDDEWESLWEAPLFSMPSASILDKPAPKE